MLGPAPAAGTTAATTAKKATASAAPPGIEVPSEPGLELGVSYTGKLNKEGRRTKR